MDLYNNFTGSIHDQMRANRWKTMYLFIIFPIIIIGLTYLGLLISFSFSENIETSPIRLANEMMRTMGFWVILGISGWTLISYFWGSRMIMGFSGAKAVQKKDNKELYRIIENLSITAGLAKSPDIYIIEDMSLNAFATGTNYNNAKVAISRGMLKTLNHNEIEAVMAHEIGHILNKDIRTMLLAVTLVGAIEMIGEILIRTGRGKKGKNPLPILGLLFLTAGVLIGTLTRLAISREREFLADATGGYLCNNTAPLASALEKIAKDARIEILDGKASMAGLCIADPTQNGSKQAVKKQIKKKSAINKYWLNIWSTHPPIKDRIKRLRAN